MTAELWVAIVMVAVCAVVSYLLFKGGRSKEALVALAGTVVGILMLVLRRKKPNPEPLVDHYRPPDPEPVANAGLSVVEDRLNDVTDKIDSAVSGDDPAGDISDLANARRRGRE